jgi:CRISPR-associated endonuclease/helicase Cas3
MGGAEWEEQRKATLRVIREVFDPPEPPDSVDVAAAALACAVVILSDWLVSQESFLTERLPYVPESSQTALLPSTV